MPMKKSFTLSLSNPCSEKWETFRPTPKGAFCQSCSKEVIDFTALSDQQIIDFFKNNPLNSCGRFRPEQLTNYRFDTEAINPGWRLWKAGLMAIMLALVSKPSVGQSNEKQRIELGVDDTFPVENDIEKKLIAVNGTVSSLDDDSALPGVTVRVVGTTIETYTDVNGKFSFSQPLPENDSLAFMFIGLKSQIQAIAAGQEMNVKMEYETIQLGGYLVGGVQATNKISFRRWWWKLKNIF